MSRLLRFLVAAGAVTATVLLVTVNNPHLGFDPAPEAGAEPEGGGGAISERPTAPPEAPPPPPVPASWFAMETEEGMVLGLRGVLPRAETREAVVDSVSRAAPELVAVNDGMRLDPASDHPGWLDGVAALAGRLAGSVRDPELRLGPDLARIGGTSDREDDLAALRAGFEALASASRRREDLLRLDPSRPAPETRMPLVLYLAPVEGAYRFEGSLPSYGLVRAASEAAAAAAGADRFSGNLRVSGRTVDEPWMATLPALVAALLEGGREGMELVLVDRSLTLKGEVPDEGAEARILALAKPAREAGYAVKDELTVKR